MIISVVAIVVSVLALCLSATTAWLTLFRRGQVKMTRPTLIAFVQDGKEKTTKIVIRALLFSTAQRGSIVENMYAVISRETTSVTLAYWAYGETSGLQRGGGLFVGREGVAVYHHFTLLRAGYSHSYQAGPHTLQIFANVLRTDATQKLAECSIKLDESMVKILNDKGGGVMFNWNPNTSDYVADPKPHPVPELLVV